MSTKSLLFSAAGLTLLVGGVQFPASAQVSLDDVLSAEMIAAGDAETATVSDAIASDSLLSEIAVDPAPGESILTFDNTDSRLTTESAAVPAEVTTFGSDLLAVDSSTEAADLIEVDAYGDVEADADYLPVEQSTELAQVRRRRTRGRVGATNFIGVGADFGFSEDISLALISKFAVSDQLAFRPSVLIGDDFSILAPITFDFNRFNTNVSGFQVSPYAGVGAAYQDDEDSDNDLSLLLSAGVDVPVSSSFTLNAQANWTVFSDSSDFGVTVGVGYNIGNLFR